MKNKENFFIKENFNLLPNLDKTLWRTLLLFLYPYKFLSHVNKTDPQNISTLIILFMIGYLLLFRDLGVLKFLLPWMAVDVYQKLSLGKLAQKIKIRRDAPSKAKEEEFISIDYKLSNPSPFRYSNLTCINSFEGHHDKINGTFWMQFIRNFPAHTKKFFQRKISLNHGMGEKKFGSLYCFLTDELGLHRIKFVSKTSQFINVYPKIYHSQKDRVVPEPSSRKFGNFDTYQRGENVNFYGVKEYAQGDNVKKINWKLSLKHNNLIVNEYEKNVNSNICIALNEDLRLHIGEGGFSSLEYCKDLALSLCHQHIRNNNEIHFMSHKYLCKSGSGPAFVQGLEMALGKLEYSEFEMTKVYHRGAACPKEISSYCLRIANSITPTTTVYFLTGMIPGKIFQFYSSFFQIIAGRCHRLVVITIDGTSEMLYQLKGEEEATIKMIQKNIAPEQNRLDRLARRYHFEVKNIQISSAHQYAQIIKQGLKFK